MNIFGGMKNLWIFLGVDHCKIGPIFESHFYVFKCFFLKFKDQNGNSFGMRGSRNTRQGSLGQSDKKALTTFFSLQLILQKSKKSIIKFSRFQSGSNIFQGAQLIPGGGGGPIAYSL